MSSHLIAVKVENMDNIQGLEGVIKGPDNYVIINNSQRGNIPSRIICTRDVSVGCDGVMSFCTNQLIISFKNTKSKEDVENLVNFPCLGKSYLQQGRTSHKCEFEELGEYKMCVSVKPLYPSPLREEREEEDKRIDWIVTLRDKHNPVEIANILTLLNLNNVEFVKPNNINIGKHLCMPI